MGSALGLAWWVSRDRTTQRLKELVIEKVKGTQASVFKCSVLKMSESRMLSLTELCGPNRDEYTHVVLHMFIPWRLPASGTKQVSKQPSDIF